MIAADMVVLGNRQHTAIMNLRFPLIARYMGPVALRAYLTRGRLMSHRHMHVRASDATMERDDRDSW